MSHPLNVGDEDCVFHSSLAMLLLLPPTDYTVSKVFYVIPFKGQQDDCFVLFYWEPKVLLSFMRAPPIAVTVAPTGK